MEEERNQLKNLYKGKMHIKRNENEGPFSWQLYNRQKKKFHNLNFPKKKLSHKRLVVWGLHKQKTTPWCKPHSWKIRTCWIFEILQPAHWIPNFRIATSLQQKANEQEVNSIILSQMTYLLTFWKKFQFGKYKFFLIFAKYFLNHDIMLQYGAFSWVVNANYVNQRCFSKFKKGVAGDLWTVKMKIQ